MSRILALETSTSQGSIALMDGDELVFELSMHHGRDLSRRLVPAIDDCFRLCDRSLQEIEAVAVSVGPGSFTGLRIGVTAGKTLAFALGVPTVAVSSLKAMACGAAATVDGIIVTALDARRDEVFTAAFHARDGHLDRLQPDHLATVGQMLSDLPEMADSTALWIVAEGALHPRLQPLIPGARMTRLVEDTPRAGCVVRIAKEKLYQGDTLSPAELVPVYLRRSYAEERAPAPGQ